MTCFWEGSSCEYKPSQLLFLSHLLLFYLAPSLAMHSPSGRPCFQKKDNNTERLVIIYWTSGQAGPSCGGEKSWKTVFKRFNVQLSKVNYIPRDERGWGNPTVAEMLCWDLNALRAPSSPWVCLLLWQWVADPNCRAWLASLTNGAIVLTLS